MGRTNRPLETFSLLEITMQSTLVRVEASTTTD